MEKTEQTTMIRVKPSVKNKLYHWGAKQKPAVRTIAKILEKLIVKLK
jgi:hypothetical protein